MTSPNDMTEQARLQKLEVTCRWIWPRLMAMMRSSSVPLPESFLLDCEQRDLMGRKKYGEPLHPFNGRNAVQDAYEEALDLIAYTHQASEEFSVKELEDIANCGDWPTSLGYGCELNEIVAIRNQAIELAGRLKAVLLKRAPHE